MPVLAVLPRVRIIINFVLFQAAWFACVYLAAAQLPWLAMVIVILLIGVQMLMTPNVAKEISLIALIALLGSMFDQLVLNHQLIYYQAHGWGSEAWSMRIVPVWIIALWLGFASTINVSLAWLHGKNVLAVVLGAVGGPLAYLAAQKLGAVTILSGMWSYGFLAVGWGILMPVFLYLANVVQHGQR